MMLQTASFPLFIDLLQISRRLGRLHHDGTIDLPSIITLTTIVKHLLARRSLRTAIQKVWRDVVKPVAHYVCAQLKARFIQTVNSGHSWMLHRSQVGRFDESDIVKQHRVGEATGHHAGLSHRQLSDSLKQHAVPFADHGVGVAEDMFLVELLLLLEGARHDRGGQHEHVVEAGAQASHVLRQQAVDLGDFL